MDKNQNKKTENKNYLIKLTQCFFTENAIRNLIDDTQFAILRII